MRRRIHTYIPITFRVGVRTVSNVRSCIYSWRKRVEFVVQAIKSRHVVLKLNPLRTPPLLSFLILEVMVSADIVSSRIY